MTTATEFDAKAFDANPLPEELSAEQWRDLLRRAIEYKRVPPTRTSRRRPLWSIVGQMLGLGSTRASQVCERLGFDPGEIVKEPRR
jgi:hypothetical protein